VEGQGARLVVVDPSQATVPIPDTDEVRLTAVVPSAWPTSCDRHPNDCSIGLRVDYCSSSVLSRATPRPGRRRCWMYSRSLSSKSGTTEAIRRPRHRSSTKLRPSTP
jgi:hypothetical protein